MINNIRESLRIVQIMLFAHSKLVYNKRAELVKRDG